MNTPAVPQQQLNDDVAKKMKRAHIEARLSALTTTRQRWALKPLILAPAESGALSAFLDELGTYWPAGRFAGGALGRLPLSHR